MIKRLLGLAVLLCVPFGIAFASHPGTDLQYLLLGFTADGTHVHFKKTTSTGPFEDHWHAVYAAATTKLATSQPTLRDCGGVECDKPPIDKKTGEKTVAEIHKKYGAPVAGSLLTQTPKVDAAAAYQAVQTATGYTQTFAGPGVEVKTTTKLLAKLPDLSDGNRKSVQFETEIAVTAKGATWTVKHKSYADPVDDPNNGNIQLWPQLYVQQLAVSPDRKTVAIVFAKKPFVIKPK
jgi:hypothetical protein